MSRKSNGRGLKMNDFTIEELKYIRNCMDTYRSDNKELLKKVHLMIDNYTECIHSWIGVSEKHNSQNFIISNNLVVGDYPIRIRCKLCGIHLFS